MVVVDVINKKAGCSMWVARFLVIQLYRLEEGVQNPLRQVHGIIATAADSIVSVRFTSIRMDEHQVFVDIFQYTFSIIFLALSVFTPRRRHKLHPGSTIRIIPGK